MELWLRADQPRAAPAAHRIVTEMEAGIRAWSNAGNADPEPLVSTKTADEILDVLAAYCRRINNSGH